MARGDILCPNDNLPLTLPNFVRVNPSTAELNVGEHLHLDVVANGVCSNGHRWLVEQGSILLRRIV